jgi:carbamoyltransferase
MKKVLWRYPSEQFAAMAQRTLEKCALDLVEAALDATGKTRIAAAGGLFSNIKMNGKIAALPRVENLYVFPHMGDGGLALGAAMSVNAERNGQTRYRLRNLSLGPAFSEAEVLAALKAQGAREAGANRDSGSPAGNIDPGGTQSDLLYRRLDDPAAPAARLLLGGEIILWFQGRMEIGPRALGSRSILARPDSRDMKDRLNLVLKKRGWYQPFCPSMLREDAPALLFTEGLHLDDNPFMTMAFRIRPERADLLAGVINVDGTCRPQFVGDELPLYRDLLRRLREELGYGVVLNTSFNIHGEPVVCTPAEALDMLRRTAIRYLVMENILISKLGTEPLFHF